MLDYATDIIHLSAFMELINKWNWSKINKYCPPINRCISNIYIIHSIHLFIVIHSNNDLNWQSYYILIQTLYIVFIKVRSTFTFKQTHMHFSPSVQQASGSKYSSTTSTTAISSSSGFMSIVLPSEELVSSSYREKCISMYSLFILINSSTSILSICFNKSLSRCSQTRSTQGALKWKNFKKKNLKRKTC